MAETMQLSVRVPHNCHEAILLDHTGVSIAGKRIARILGFFGLPWRALTTAEFVAPNSAGPQGLSKCAFLSSSDTFLELIEPLERDPGCIHLWETQVHSAFVYAGNDPEILQKLVRRLTGDNGAVLRKISPSVGDVAISDHLDDFCGVMAGVCLTVSNNTNGNLVLKTTKGNLVNIISCGDGATFFKLEYKGVPVFLSTSQEFIDIDAELTSQNFDVREHFFSAVPLVLYIKWAFAETCWSAPETNACLVIDDLVLKSAHGFVNFQELLFLMKRHNFSTNIAFIPWNWRRSVPEVVRLFKANPENYSISVHGCDHTRAEFGSFDRQRLYWKARRALERMNQHESITGIRHDRVMVFPQGIFSEAAMSALKHTDLIAAVNSDVTSADPHPRPISVSEVWDTAVMRYSNFPIFTRRYPWEGPENFAFDALLGKPALILIHHDYCSDRCKRLLDFVDRLNALKCQLKWRSLGEVVRRSWRQRELSPNTVEVEMYATRLRLENHSQQRKRYFIQRRDLEPSSIKEIHAGTRQIAWNFFDSRIIFEIELEPAESTTVSIRFHNLAGDEQYADTVSYGVKTMLRRYLCEIRDNYVTTAKLRFANFASR